MHSYLLSVPNRLFYNNRIRDGPHREKGFFLDKEKPILFVDLKSKETNQHPTYFNAAEADFVLNLVETLTNPEG
jgi:superfamily I DNA and/or RNA helicase